MPDRMVNRFTQLPPAIWSQILDQIPRAEMLPLMFVNRLLRSLVINKIYREANFSGYNSDGLKFAQAILDRHICPDVVSGILTAEISFPTNKEGTELVDTFSNIKHKLTALTTIRIVCPYFKDAVCAVNKLAQSYPDVLLEIHATTSGMPNENEDGNENEELSHAAKSNISKLSVVTIKSRLLLELPRLESLSAVALIHDPELSETKFPVIDELNISYVDWASLNFPASRLLELDLSPNYIYVERNDADYWERVHLFHPHIKIVGTVLEQLKLIGLKSTEKSLPDGPQAGAANLSVDINAHSLRRLFICNINPSIIEAMLSSTKAPSLEFLSLFPVTIPSLRGLLTSKLPLKLVLAVVNDASFHMKNESELASLTRWIEDAAAVYPLDLRDFSNSLDREIYFGDGMWCNINQTAFKKYAANVQP